MRPYEIIDHTADIGVRVSGKTLKELFANAAFALFDIVADLEGIKASAEVDIEAEGDTREELLVNWLDELLYNFYTKMIIFSEFDITVLDEKSLKAKARGKFLGDNRNRLKTEVKAITHHGLNIREKDGIYRAEIIFDV